MSTSANAVGNIRNGRRVNAAIVAVLFFLPLGTASCGPQTFTESAYKLSSSSVSNGFGTLYYKAQPELLLVLLAAFVCAVVGPAIPGLVLWVLGGIGALITKASVASQMNGSPLTFSTTAVLPIFIIAYLLMGVLLVLEIINRSGSRSP